jgi:hypothetical protein
MSRRTFDLCLVFCVEISSREDADRRSFSARSPVAEPRTLDERLDRSFPHRKIVMSGVLKAWSTKKEVSMTFDNTFQCKVCNPARDSLYLLLLSRYSAKFGVVLGRVEKTDGVISVLQSAAKTEDECRSLVEDRTA